MSDDAPELLNFIDGEFHSSSCGHWIDDPAPATGRLIARIPCSDASDIDTAVAAAKSALPEWSALSHEERAVWLDKIADALEARAENIAELESLDTGKPISLAREVDAKRSVSNFRFFASQILPRAASLVPSVTAGADPLDALHAEDF